MSACIGIPIVAADVNTHTHTVVDAVKDNGVTPPAAIILRRRTETFMHTAVRL